MRNGEWKMENPSLWSPLLSSARRVAQLAPSPCLPLSPSPLLPFSFALCSWPLALYNERGQGSASDTPGSHFGSRPGSGHFPIRVCEPRLPRLDLLLIFLSPDAAGGDQQDSFLLHQSCPLIPQAVISRNRVPEARIDLSKLSLTNRSVVKQERPER